ncbi:Ribonuclease BN, tRNA processing enzyme [Desulfacinum infernum DSM 9756]|uniref:Ribonuclease BN, tRNA processing enzyme n=1 Tax=Desulfacinum infernum DSM 9756 TaxID=1121391 RepID=A0A1M5CI74_9BACT|nr:ribonuclease Z [Desulfacinum infernum]SHF54380.1 Ribonuclease BN, tRNA processing enzyme [Desulfacinum infernum DSM 9756]
MKIVFLGVGEACDERHPNTSLLVEAPTDRGGKKILLDCGFSAAHRYFSWDQDPNSLDALWISHFHGDHFLGVPLLLLRFWETNRSKPLAVVSRPGGGQIVRNAMELAYPGFWSRIQFPVEEVALEPGADMKWGGLWWRAASTEHGQPNLSVRLETSGLSLFYSGDGRPTGETTALAQGCDLAVHEAFVVDDGERVPGHGTVKGCLRWAEEAQVRRLALVHIQRDVRRTQWDRIREVVDAGAKMPVVIPEEGDVLEVGG